MTTRYEKLIGDREALVNMIQHSSIMDSIDYWYCKIICPNKDEDCIDCDANHSEKEQINLWLDEEV